MAVPAKQRTSFCTVPSLQGTCKGDSPERTAGDGPQEAEDAFLHGRLHPLAQHHHRREDDVAAERNSGKFRMRCISKGRHPVCAER